MTKVILGLMAIYLVGDPGLQYLLWMGDLKVFIITAAVALVSMPWIAKQVGG
jgi:hypothetical protein